MSKYVNKSATREENIAPVQVTEWDMLSAWHENQERQEQNRTLCRGEIGITACRETTAVDSARNYSVVLGMPALALAAELLPDGDPETETRRETTEAVDSFGESFTLYIDHDELDDKQNLKLAA